MRAMCLSAAVLVDHVMLDVLLLLHHTPGSTMRLKTACSTVAIAVR
jgi:hypothetical protein